jgi:hypothetical protein
MTYFATFCQQNSIDESLHDLAELIDQHLELRLEEERTALEKLMIINNTRIDGILFKEFRDVVVDLVQLRAKINKLQDLIEKCCGDKPPEGEYL